MGAKFFARSPHLSRLKEFAQFGGTAHPAGDSADQDSTTRGRLQGFAIVFAEEPTQFQTYAQLAHQNQTSVGSDARTLKISFQRRIKRELIGLILCSPTGSMTPRVRRRINTGVGYPPVIDLRTTRARAWQPSEEEKALLGAKPFGFGLRASWVTGIEFRWKK